MCRRRSAPIWRIAGAVAVALVSAAALGACGRAAPVIARAVAAKGPRPVVVPLRVRWGTFGARPMIMVRVGNGRPFPVLLDTGSTGLHIYAPAVRTGAGSGVTIGGRPDSVTYFDGTVQRGVIGRARLTIGRLRTTRPVSFGYISDVSCVRELTRCPGAGGIGADISRKVYGFLGVGLAKSHDGLGNPLLALPRPYARRWNIAVSGSHGALTIGERIHARPVARFRLVADGRDANGARAWKDDQAKVCWAAVGLRGAGCEPTVFDTGSVTMLWYGGLLSRATTYYNSLLVTPGTFIAAWQKGHAQPFWTFTAGTDFSHDTVLALRGGHPLVIAAIQAFFHFKIAYDDASGQIALYEPNAS